MKKKIAFFDIDKTLIYGDSLFSLYKYGCKNWLKYTILAPAVPAVYLLYRMRIIEREKMKEYFYRPLEKFEKSNYDEFFDKYILGRKIDKTFLELLRLKKEGYYILLATASPYAYMRLWKERGYADGVVATKTLYKNERYYGKIVGRNCNKQEKLRRIKEYLEENNIEVDYKNSIGFSDSDFDIPMMSLCKTKIRVLKNGEHTEFLTDEKGK